MCAKFDQNRRRSRISLVDFIWNDPTCLSSIGGQTAGPIMTKFGTYMRIDLGMVPTKKKGPTYGPEGWAHWGHSSKRVLSWRATSSDSEPLAKQREEL